MRIRSPHRKKGHTETSSQPPLPFSVCAKYSIWELAAATGSTAQRRRCICQIETIISVLPGPAFIGDTHDDSASRDTIADDSIKDCSAIYWSECC